MDEQVLDTVVNPVQRLSSIESPGLVKSTFKTFAAEVCNFIGRTIYSRPPPMTSKLLNLGCGFRKYPSFVNADSFVLYSPAERSFMKPDWMLDATKSWRCASDHWDGIFCEHVIEHLPYAKAVFCLGEAYRTLRPGCWIRIVVPDVRRYVNFYNRESSAEEFHNFSSGPEAISSLTQKWGHVSVWDGQLLAQTLKGLGFTSAREVAFQVGFDNRLTQDTPERRWESCYVEAMKPKA